MRKITELDNVVFHHCFIESRLHDYFLKTENELSSNAESHRITAKKLRDIIRDSDLYGIYPEWLKKQQKAHKDCSIAELVEKLIDRADNKTIFVIGPFINKSFLWSAEKSVELSAGSMLIGVRMNTLDLNEEERENIRAATTLLKYVSSDVKVIDPNTLKPICLDNGVCIPTGSILFQIKVD